MVYLLKTMKFADIKKKYFNTSMIWRSYEIPIVHIKYQFTITILIASKATDKNYGFGNLQMHVLWFGCFKSTPKFKKKDIWINESIPKAYMIF
jgi:hypothetical protein